MNEQLRTPRPGVLGLFLTQADIRQQSRQQRPMNFAVLAWRLIQLQFQFALDDLHDLTVDVMPFRHPHIGEEIVAAILALLGFGQMPLLFLEVLPELQQRDEIGLFVLEAGMLLVGMGGLVDGPFARIGHAQRGHDDGDFGQAMLVGAGQQHAPQPGVDRQLAQLAAQFGQVIPLIQRVDLLQGAQPVPDQTRVGRLDKRKAADVAQLQRVHLQDDGSEIGAKDFRIGKLGAIDEILLGIQANGDTRPDTSATAGALVGAGPGDFFNRQPLQLAAMRIAADAGVACIDHGADARHGQRRLRHIGGQHDAARAGRPEHLFLLRLRQPRIQGQNLALGRMMLAQRLRRLANLALAAEEDEDIARHLAPEFVHRIEDGGLFGFVGLVALLDLHRPIAHIHRIGAPGHVDDGRIPSALTEMAGKAFRVDGGRGNDQLEIRPARQQPLEIPKQEIDVQAALVGLVDDQRVVLVEKAVMLGFRQQDAVGHQLDQTLRPGLVLKPHLVAHCLPQRLLQFLGDARRHRAGGDAARLGMANEAGLPTPRLQADLGQLRRLAGTRLAADDDHLTGKDRGQDFVLLLRHREIGILQRRHARRPGRADRRG